MLALPCVMLPPTVLYCPPKLIPVVRCTTIVTVNAVTAPVLLNFTSSSLKYGLLELTTGVTVTPPFPLLPVVTVSVMVAV